MNHVDRGWLPSTGRSPYSRLTNKTITLERRKMRPDRIVGETERSGEIFDCRRTPSQQNEDLPSGGLEEAPADADCRHELFPVGNRDRKLPEFKRIVK